MNGTAKYGKPPMAWDILENQTVLHFGNLFNCYASEFKTGIINSHRYLYLSHGIYAFKTWIIGLVLHMHGSLLKPAQHYPVIKGNTNIQPW